MHNHPQPTTCDHKLEFCEHCNTVYCEKCKEEWKKETISIPTCWPHDNGTWPQTFPGVTYYGSTTSGDEPCMFDDLPPGTYMLSCPCPKCTPRM